MAVSSTQTLDVTQALADLLAGVEGLRVEYYVNDRSRPPVAIFGLPAITWNDEDSGFCWGVFDVPITIVTARTDALAAQQELSRLVRDVANALNHQAPDGIFDIAMIDARPSTTTIGGQELPSYLVRCQVRA